MCAAFQNQWIAQLERKIIDTIYGERESKCIPINASINFSASIDIEPLSVRQTPLKCVFTHAKTNSFRTNQMQKKFKTNASNQTSIAVNLGNFTCRERSNSSVHLQMAFAIMMHRAANVWHSIQFIELDTSEQFYNQFN